jgi:parvulin-like peptidyl-prolyl isomerase
MKRAQTPPAPRMRPRRLAIVAALGVASAVALVAGATVAGDRIVVEAIVVRVNDRVVTISDFRERLRQELSQVPEPPSGDNLKGFADNLLASLVEEMVLLERAQEKKVQVEDAAVDSAIQSLRDDNNLKDDKAFEQALKSSGMTLPALKERYRQSILLHRVVQGEVKPSEITEEELRQMYEADKARFAVPAKVELEQLSFEVAADGSDRDQVLRRARGLVERVRGGSDLVGEATLAGVEVQELGAIPESDLRPELVEALTPLKDNGLADPIAYPGGYQVIHLVRRIPAGYQPFEEVKESLRRRRSEEMYRQQTRGLVDRLKHNYLVEVHPELVARAIADLV